MEITPKKDFNQTGEGRPFALSCQPSEEKWLANKRCQQHPPAYPGKTVGVGPFILPVPLGMHSVYILGTKINEHESKSNKFWCKKQKNFPRLRKYTWGRGFLQSRKNVSSNKHTTLVLRGKLYSKDVCICRTQLWSCVPETREGNLTKKRLTGDQRKHILDSLVRLTQKVSPGRAITVLLVSHFKRQDGAVWTWVTPN